MNFDWIDISIGFHPETILCEGDPPFLRKGGKVSEKTPDARSLCMTMGAYAGTHVGAPILYQKTGMGIDNMPFTPTVGLAKVIEIHDRHVVKVEELRQHRIFQHDRLLLKTKKGAHDTPSHANAESAIYMEPAAASWLVERRISTVGIDTLSLAGAHETGKETRRLFSEAGIWVIEGLDLARVHSGEYMLICLPLKILNGDDAPARAILQRVR
jgi:arylformamidase